MSDEIESVHFKAGGPPQVIKDDETGEMRVLHEGDMWLLTTMGRIYVVPSDVVPEVIRDWGLDECVPVC